MLRRLLVNAILRGRFHWNTEIKPSIYQRYTQLIQASLVSPLPSETCRIFKPVVPIISSKMSSQLSSQESAEIDEPIRTNEDDLEEAREQYAMAREDSLNKWLVYNKTCHIYLYKGGGEPSESIAAFDLDGTIIKPKSARRRVPKSATDWQFFSVWTKVKLQQVLRENGARFVIFTNQNGVGLKLVTLGEIQERIELVTKRLDIPCTVFIATEKDDYRKPNLGMFRLFQESFQDSVPIDLNKSFYCGDAVGYPSHSDADIKFAQNLKLPFLPPEKFLRGVKPKLVDSE